MQNVLLSLHLVVTIALIVVVLLQRSEGGALGIGGGGPGSMFTARGQANLLTRATALLAAAFMALSILLAIVSGAGRNAIVLPETEAPASEPAFPSDGPAPAFPSLPGE